MPKILVIDDDLEVRRTLNMLLKTSGYEVLVAADGVQGMIMAVHDRPDLILLDLALQGGDGFGVLQKMRDSNKLEQTPILVRSGLDPGINGPKAIQHGATAFIPKSTSDEELLATVHRYIGKTSHVTDGAATGPRKVLIIDDNDEIRMTVSMMLRAAGYHVKAAADGVTGMVQVRREKPEVVILDIRMPGGNGLAWLERFKGDAALQDVKVIVYSGEDPIASRDQALSSGAVAFLSKPAEEDTILETVRQALES